MRPGFISQAGELVIDNWILAYPPVPVTPGLAGVRRNWYSADDSTCPRLVESVRWQLIAPPSPTAPSALPFGQPQYPGQVAPYGLPVHPQALPRNSAAKTGGVAGIVGAVLSLTHS